MHQVAIIPTMWIRLKTLSVELSSGLWCFQPLESSIQAVDRIQVARSPGRCCRPELVPQAQHRTASGLAFTRSSRDCRAWVRPSLEPRQTVRKVELGRTDTRWCVWPSGWGRWRYWEFRLLDPCSLGGRHPTTAPIRWKAVFVHMVELSLFHRFSPWLLILLRSLRYWLGYKLCHQGLSRIFTFLIYFY